MMKPINQCIKCKHKLNGLKCKAFPNRIPILIWREEIIHDIIQDNQIGDFIYEPLTIYHNSDLRIKRRQENLLAQQESLKEEIPTLLNEEAQKQGYDLTTLKMIIYDFEMKKKNLFIHHEFSVINSKKQKTKLNQKLNLDYLDKVKTLIETKKIENNKIKRIRLIIYSNKEYNYEFS